MYEKSSNEERKILAIFAESSSNILAYKEIKEIKSTKSEPSRILKNMVEKNLLIKESRGKYRLRDKMFKEHLTTDKPYAANGTPSIHRLKKTQTINLDNQIDCPDLIDKY